MEDLRITRLVVNNVGVFEHLDLSFKKQPLKDKAEIHIFTGENGTGKTTLLEALTYFDVWFNKSLLNNRSFTIPIELDKKLNPKKRFNRSNVYEDNEIEINFGKRKMSFNLSGKAILDDSTIFEKYFGNNNKSETQFSKHNHEHSFFAYNSHRQLEEARVEAFRNFEFNPITEALTFDKRGSQANIFQWIANNKTRAALSFQKGNKKDSERYLTAIQKIEWAVGEIIGRKIEFVIDVHSLNIMVKIDEETVHFDTLADGYKSIISWLTDLMFRLDYMPPEGQENFTLFLDEIDIHLHPAAQRRILPVIQKLFPKAQIFLTTHSPFVIGSVDDAWVYKFKLDEKGNSVLAQEPFLTEDAKSYRYILEEVFDINRQFGVNVEKQLDEFYKLRNEIIRHPEKKDLLREATKIAKELAVQSEEMQAIMGSEMKQLSRILQKEIAL